MRSLDTRVLQHILRYEDGPLGALEPQAKHLTQKTDAQLVEIIQSDSHHGEEAFNVLYNRHYQSVWKCAQAKTNSYDDAMDVFARVWRTVIKDLPTKFGKEGKGNNVKAWLLTIARNQAANLGRTADKDRKIIDALQYIYTALEQDHVLIEDSSFSAVQSQVNIIIREAISKLNPTHQKIIMLRYFGKKQIQEIAQLLNKKPNAVAKAHGRALRKLKSHIQI